ncbi:MAG: ACP phosphodiesterase [Bacteroidota bacterium]
MAQLLTYLATHQFLPIMNYLAHLFLSCQNDDLLLGNFIADAIRNKEVGSYPETVQKGIFLHRQIDSFTDTHPIVLQGTRRLYSHHGKYAPVVIDVYFDNLLANNWYLYASESLEVFAERMYATLKRRHLDLPPKMQGYVPRMIASKWLTAYANFDGLQYTFERMDQRTKFPSNFKNAVSHLRADYAQFNEEFNQFFPDVIQMVNEFCGC